MRILEGLLYKIPLRLRTAFRRNRVEQELDEELSFHLARQVHEDVSLGANAQEARRQALLAMQGVERCKEECRDARHMNTIENWIKDFGFAARTLRKSPLFAMTAMLTIALGVGASTAIFSVVNAVLLRPLPYPQSNRLALASMEFRQAGIKNMPVNNGDFYDLWHGAKAVFDDMAGVFTFRVIVPREDGRPERIYKALVTSNFFRMMGAHVIYGRDFSAADAVARPGHAPPGLPVGDTAILSYDYWQRRYGGKTSVIGREMGGPGQHGPQIVGVLAPGFELLLPAFALTEERPDVWIENNLGNDRGPAGLRIIGRMKAGVTLEQARHEVEVAAAEMRKTSPRFTSARMNIDLDPLLPALVAEVRPTILALMGAVILLLLIACANVANLLLVRSSLRDRELAVRVALGANSWRLVRQMLVEALLLAVAGTAIGIVLAWAGARELLRIAPANLPRVESIHMDVRVLSFAALAGLASALIFGLMPAWRATRSDAMQVLHGARSFAGLRSGSLLRNGVVVAEVMLSFVLLVGSGLMVRSFIELRRVDPGYDPHGLLTFLLVRDWKFDSPVEQRQAFLRTIRDRLHAVPGVVSASACSPLPLTGSMMGGFPWTTERAAAEGVKPQLADIENVLPGYFETMRSRFVAGRSFTDADNAPGRNVVVIDDLLAAKAFPGESAVGKRILLPVGPRPVPVQVIGVVKHERLTSLTERGAEQIYLPDAFMLYGVSRSWAIRTTSDPMSLVAPIRRALGGLDPRLLMQDVATMDSVVDKAQAQTRFSLLLIGVFAAIAALLAAIGLYGVLSTLVAQRTSEIGVRMALGAEPRGIFRLVVGKGLGLSVAGLVLGLAAALGATRMMRSMLVGIQPTDPATFVAIALVFLLIASVACWLPARRASRLDPAATLREE